jgi:hypothetical protein
MNWGKASSALRILAPTWGHRNRSWRIAKPQMKVMDTDNLELHRLPLQLYGTNLKVNSNGTNIALCVCVVCKPQKQAGLQKEMVVA